MCCGFERFHAILVRFVFFHFENLSIAILIHSCVFFCLSIKQSSVCIFLRLCEGHITIPTDSHQLQSYRLQFEKIPHKHDFFTLNKKTNNRCEDV